MAQDPGRLVACIRHFAQLLDKAGKARTEAPHVGKDDPGGDPVQLNRAASRQPRESLLDLIQEAERCHPRELASADRTKAGLRRSDEVQHGQTGLTVRPTQASAELLKKDQRTLGRSEKQHGVDLGHVDPFVEQVDAEDDVDRAVPQVA